MDDFLRDKISNYDKLPLGIKINLTQCIEQIQNGNYRHIPNNEEAYSAAISEGACKLCLNDGQIQNKTKKEIAEFIKEYIAHNR